MFPSDSSGSGELPGWLQQSVNEKKAEAAQVESKPGTEQTEELLVVKPDTELPVKQDEPVVTVQEPEATRPNGSQRQTGGDTAKIPVIVSPPRKPLDETEPKAEPLKRSPAKQRTLVLTASLACFLAFMILRGTHPWLWGALALLFTYKTVKQILEAGSVQIRMNKDG